MHKACALTALFFLSACGQSLLGGPELESILGVMPPPANGAWELRWYRGQGIGLDIGCTLVDVPEAQLDEIIWGQLQSPMPVVDMPLSPVDGSEGRWALALLVLADETLYQPWDPEAAADDEALEGEDEEEDEGEGEGDGEVEINGSLELERGVWGAAQGYALLYHDGNAAFLEDGILIPGTSAPDLSQNPILVRYIPEVTHALGAFEGSLLPLDASETLDIETTGLTVTSSHYMARQEMEIFAALPFGKLLAGEDCPQ